MVDFFTGNYSRTNLDEGDSFEDNYLGDVISNIDFSKRESFDVNSLKKNFQGPLV